MLLNVKTVVNSCFEPSSELPSNEFDTAVCLNDVNEQRRAHCTTSNYSLVSVITPTHSLSHNSTHCDNQKGSEAETSSPSTDGAEKTSSESTDRLSSAIENKSSEKIDITKTTTEPIPERQKTISTVETKGKQAGKHVMLSYNKLSRDTAMKVKDKLIGRGHKVWIDMEQITSEDSTLEAMGRAIEDSIAMLMFYSSSYKQSINCRTEAEYAFEKRIHVIPVLTELNYMADGWLGMIIGTKYRYQLANPLKYEKDLGNLLCAVDNLAAGSTKSIPEPDTKQAPVANVPTHTEKTEVPTSTQLIASHRFSPDFEKRLKELDEELLSILASTLKTSPALFYDIISRDNMTDLLKLHKLVITHGNASVR